MGKCKHELYNTYCNMKYRCYNKNSNNYHNYGAKGIKVCDRWLGPDGFENFIKDMGDRPKGFQLDRIDSKGNYESSNCRWADTTTQILNRGMRKSSKSGFRGVSYASYRSSNKKWRAAICFNHKDYVIGYFTTKEEAALAYDTKAKELHGKEAKLNFPNNNQSGTKNFSPLGD